MQLSLSRLTAVIRANRFHIKPEGIRALAEALAAENPDFKPSRWFTSLESKPGTPLTGAPCHCRRGIERDNCPNCEGTGKAIDFARIHRERK